MTHTFFADTSFLIAFYNIRDDHHAAAKELIAKFIERKENVQFHITDYIFDETLTTILNRGGKHLALDAAKKILASPSISLHMINTEIFRNAYDIFVRYADQEWSFTDCSSIAYLKHRFKRSRIQVATFDHHFEAAGFQIVP
jgi:uncharacterized protein